MSKIVEEIGKRSIKDNTVDYRIGDTVDVHVRITEGDKERIQTFTGTLIGCSGKGSGASITVRRLVQGNGVERVFPINSPRIEKIAVRKTGKVRRAKLNFLRGRTGKATRLAERRDYRGKAAKNAPAAEAAAPVEAPAEAPASEEPGESSEA